MTASLDRRTFVKLGLAAATATGFASAEAKQDPSVLVFFDGRYSDSRRFAGAFASADAERFDTTTDVAHLWYSRLQSRVQDSPVRLAGLTTHSDLFVLERCAADARMQLRFGAFHDCRGASTLTHTLNRHDERSASALTAAGTDWPVALASSMLEDVGLQRPAPLRLITGVARAPDHPGTLVSWLIA